jgi:hypothetical protein
MAVRIWSEETQSRLEMGNSAGKFTLRELVVGYRRTQQAEKKVPIIAAAHVIHRLFHRFVGFEELSTIEEFHPGEEGLAGRVIGFHGPILSDDQPDNPKRQHDYRAYKVKRRSQHAIGFVTRSCRGGG